MTTTNDTKQQVKTIDVIALEWFDKVNGNSYFAGYVTVNYGMDDEKTLNMPFQYGYESQYIQEAGDILRKEGLIIPREYTYQGKDGKQHSNGFEGLTTYCRDNGIILRTTKHENCKKRELMQF